MHICNRLGCGAVIKDEYVYCESCAQELFMERHGKDWDDEEEAIEEIMLGGQRSRRTKDD